jgi:hypothetical protein
VASNLRSISQISSTCITKTISNCFFPPEKLPLALEEKQFFRTSTSKPFFAKARKLADAARGRKQENPVMVPNALKNLLRAKSTSIKQKRLQEFYISREGRLEQAECLEHHQKTSSNLFKPNFPAKKQKPGRRHSLHLEKSLKLTDTPLEASHDTLKLPAKAVTFQSITEDLNDCALREKRESLNVFDKLGKKKADWKESNLLWREGKRKRRQEKENILEFDLEPWGHH